MNANIEALYYACIDRIDDEDLESAEEYLIGCVTFLHRQSHGRADRDRIKDDFEINRGIHKYEEELRIISRLEEAKLHTLIASSLDLSELVAQIEGICKIMENAVYDEVQAYNQTAKIRRCSKGLEVLNGIINDKGGFIQPSLFEGENGA